MFRHLTSRTATRCDVAATWRIPRSCVSGVEGRVKCIETSCLLGMYRSDPIAPHRCGVRCRLAWEQPLCRCWLTPRCIDASPDRSVMVNLDKDGMDMPYSWRDNAEAWCRGLTRGPVKAEIAGSNPVASADRERGRSTALLPFVAMRCADAPHGDSLRVHSRHCGASP